MPECREWPSESAGSANPGGRCDRRPATGESGGFLSVLDIERRSHELLVQSFHLFDETQMVIKTQAIIEVVRG